MSVRLFLVPALLLMPLAVRAETPRRGTDSYTTVYVVASSSTMKFGDRTVFEYETSGVSRNDNGGTIFNNMSARCLGMVEIIGNEKTNRGTCVDMDNDGNEIFSTYEAKGNAGVHTFVGGTGKYAGLSGRAPYTVQQIRSSDGRPMAVVLHKATWKLP